MLKYALFPLGAVLIFVTVIAVNPWIIIDATPKGYGDSLGSVLSGGSGRCDIQLSDRIALCDVEIDAGSGPGARYVLRKDGDRCWTAIQTTRRDHGERPDWIPSGVRVSGKTIEGCVTLWQEIRPSIL